MQSIQIVAEFAGKNWSAFSPNLEGVYVTAASLKDLIREFADAARFHVEGLAEDGEPIPPVDLNTYVVSPIVYIDSLGSLRKALGITQSDIASQTGTTQPRVSAIEKNPDSVTFGALRQYLAYLEKAAGLPAISLVERELAS